LGGCSNVRADYHCRDDSGSSSFPSRGTARQVEKLLCDLRLDPVQLAVPDGRYARESKAVQEIIRGTSADRGDEAIVDQTRGGSTSPSSPSR